MLKSCMIVKYGDKINECMNIKGHICEPIYIVKPYKIIHFFFRQLLKKYSWKLFNGKLLSPNRLLISLSVY